MSYDLHQWLALAMEAVRRWKQEQTALFNRGADESAFLPSDLCQYFQENCDTAEDFWVSLLRWRLNHSFSQCVRFICEYGAVSKGMARIVLDIDGGSATEQRAAAYVDAVYMAMSIVRGEQSQDE